MKIYVIRKDGDWELTDKVTKELASIRHLNEAIRIGSKPFDGEIEVLEGVYVWNGNKNEYAAHMDQNDETKVKNTEKRNTVGEIIKVFGIITIVLGIVVGIFSIAYPLIAITYFLSGVIAGVLFLGFAEVINLLEEIKNKL